MAILTPEQIIKKRIKLFDEMILLTEQQKKIHKSIMKCRDEMWQLDKMCSLRWRKKK